MIRRVGSIQDLKLLTDYELNEEEADIDYE